MTVLNDPTIVTHDDALALLRAFMQGAQKARSNLFETFDGIEPKLAESILAAGNPWLFGPKRLLPKLVEHVSRSEAGEPISGSDLFNWAIIALRFEPLIGMAMPLYSPRFRDLTEPDISWVGRTFVR